MVEPRFVRTQFLPEMTVGAAGDIRVVFARLEMADETAALCDRDVISLDDLGMTARTAQLLPSTEILQVDFVVEDDFLEWDAAFEDSFLMAARPQAALVRDFGPRFGLDVELRPVAEDLVEAFQLDSQEGPHAGRVMALAALDSRMGGFFPALVEGLHVMADRTELVVGRVLGRPGEKEKDKNKYSEDDEPSFFS
jgi:hypothetical protein